MVISNGSTPSNVKQSSKIVEEIKGPRLTQIKTVLDNICNETENTNECNPQPSLSNNENKEENSNEKEIKNGDSNCIGNTMPNQDHEPKNSPGIESIEKPNDEKNTATKPKDTNKCIYGPQGDNKSIEPNVKPYVPKQITNLKYSNNYKNPIQPTYHTEFQKITESNNIPSPSRYSYSIFPDKRGEMPNLPDKNNYRYFNDKSNFYKHDQQYRKAYINMYNNQYPYENHVNNIYQYTKNPRIVVRTPNAKPCDRTDYDGSDNEPTKIRYQNNFTQRAINKGIYPGDLNGQYAGANNIPCIISPLQINQDYIESASGKMKNTTGYIYPDEIEDKRYGGHGIYHEDKNNGPYRDMVSSYPVNKEYQVNYDYEQNAKNLQNYNGALHLSGLNKIPNAMNSGNYIYHPNQHKSKNFYENNFLMQLKNSQNLEPCINVKPIASIAGKLVGLAMKEIVLIARDSTYHILKSVKQTMMEDPELSCSKVNKGERKNVKFNKSGAKLSTFKKSLAGVGNNVSLKDIELLTDSKTSSLSSFSVDFPNEIRNSRCHSRIAANPNFKDMSTNILREPGQPTSLNNNSRSIISQAGGEVLTFSNKQATLV